MKLTKAGTTLLTGKPPSVSSLPMTSSWHISMAAWSCWDSSPVACRPCNSCWALEPGKRRCLFIYLGKSNNKLNQQPCLRWLYLLAPLPMVLWNSCDMRGPKGPKRCGGRPLASSRAAKKQKTPNVPSPTSPFDAHYRCALVKSSRMIASFLARCQNSLKSSFKSVHTFFCYFVGRQINNKGMSWNTLKSSHFRVIRLALPRCGHAHCSCDWTWSWVQKTETTRNDKEMESQLIRSFVALCMRV